MRDNYFSTLLKAESKKAVKLHGRFNFKFGTMASLDRRQPAFRTRFDADSSALCPLHLQRLQAKSL